MVSIDRMYVTENHISISFMDWVATIDLSVDRTTLIPEYTVCFSRGSGYKKDIPDITVHTLEEALALIIKCQDYKMYDDLKKHLLTH